MYWVMLWQKGDVRDMQDSQSWLVTLTILARQFDFLTRRNRLSWGGEWCVLHEKSVFLGVRNVLLWCFGKRKPMKTWCFFVSRKVLRDVTGTARRYSAQTLWRMSSGSRRRCRYCASQVSKCQAMRGKERVTCVLTLQKIAVLWFLSWQMFVRVIIFL